LQLKRYWQLNEHGSVTPAKTLAERISGLGELSQFAVELQEPAHSVLDVGELSQFATKLRKNTDTVLIVFPEQPPKNLLHIMVQEPFGEYYRESYVVLFCRCMLR